MKEVLAMGQAYYYLSIPNNCDISNIKVLDGIYKETANLELYYYSKDFASIKLVCDAIKNVVVNNFKSDWTPDNDEVYYWITLDNKSHLRTLYVKSGTGNYYNNNYFKTREEAENMLNRIKQQLY